MKLAKMRGGSKLQINTWKFGICVSTIFAVCLGVSDGAEAKKTLSGHIPRLQTTAISRVSSEKEMDLAIGLPLKNRKQLEAFISQLSNPTSSIYGQYLTPEQFETHFGPSQEDYDKVIAFATNNGMTITAKHSNRTMLEIKASSAQIEKAFGVKMQWYQHPTESRIYFAPDTEPKIDATVPVSHISGLNNYSLPKMRLKTAPSSAEDIATPRTGSGPSGCFMGYDFRKAYMPNAALTGAGQSVGLFQLDGFYTKDINSYISYTGLPSVPVQAVLINGFSGRPSVSDYVMEVSLDIEMAISMAPGLSAVYVYEADPNKLVSVNAIFNRMATDNLCKQLSCSWGFDIDENTEQIFLQFAAQGQSLFLASGDNGAFGDVVEQPSDSPYITVVGGTKLTTTTAGAWSSETGWSGSGGGISTVFSLPAWQKDIVTSLNHASSTMRNLPDVSMVAYNIGIYANGKQSIVSGTSASAPLWAGLAALANERASTLGKPPVGFFNPALYSVGKTKISSSFHDITTGNNYSTDNPSLFPAVAGYDLVTGWGTPLGTNLIEALLSNPSEPLVITSPLGFIASGPVGGSFSPSSQSYTLTNTGSSSLDWTLVNTSGWLSASITSGTLAPGETATTVLSVNTSASDLSLGQYDTTVTFQDTTSGVDQTRDFTLSIGNAGFESGDFTYWTLNAMTDVNFVTTVDYSQFLTNPLVDGVSDTEFVGSGLSSAFLGQNTRLGYLSQAIPTETGKSYLFSFWVSNPATGTPNEFQAYWNGNVIYDGVNLSAFAGTTKTFLVTATGTSTEIKFGFRNDDNAFGLDCISVQPISSPSVKKVHLSGSKLTLTWSTTVGLSYVVQYTDDLANPTWINLGNAVTATASTLSISDTMGGTQRFYRVIIP